MTAVPITRFECPTGAWRAAGLVLVALLAVLAVAYYPTAASMVAIWMRSETYAHAFVVPPIVLWLIWRRRAALAALTPSPSPWVLLPLAGAALAWSLGALVGAGVVSQFAFTAMLVLAVPLVLGWHVAWQLAFPLAFIFFAVPAGEALTPTLMQWTADFTVAALRFSGIPVYREGLQFVIPSGKWSVVEACSGVRYLMASFMVGSLFAYLNFRSLKRRLVFIAVSIAMPIIANWVRAYLIVMLGHLSNNELATGADHLVYGWVFFGIVIMGMFFIGARWAEPDAEPASPDSLASGSAAAVPAASAWCWGVVAALLVLTPPLLQLRLLVPRDAPAPLLLLPSTLGTAWQVDLGDRFNWHPAFGEPSVEARQVYANAAGQAVGVHIAYYRNQTETRKLVSSRNLLVRGEDTRWNVLRSGSRQLSTGLGEIPVRTSELLGAADLGLHARPHIQAWQFYWVGGRVTTSEVMAKLFSGWQRLSGKGDESALVLVYAAESESGTAAPLLEKFLRENFRSLDALLQATRAAR